LYNVNDRGGITAVVVYSPVIFAQAGYGPTKASWMSALNNTFGILGTFISAFLIDRFGRRKLLFWGSAGCSISMFLGGAFSKLVVDHPDKAEQYGAAATLFLFLFTLCFSTTWLMVTWICITFMYVSKSRSHRDFPHGSSSQG
jgi:MFS family permease